MTTSSTHEDTFPEFLAAPDSLGLFRSIQTLLPSDKIAGNIPFRFVRKDEAWRVFHNIAHNVWGVQIVEVPHAIEDLHQIVPSARVGEITTHIGRTIHGLTVACVSDGVMMILTMLPSNAPVQDTCIRVYTLNDGDDAPPVRAQIDMADELSKVFAEMKRYLHHIE